MSRNLRKLLKETTPEEWIEGENWYAKALDLAIGMTSPDNHDDVCFLIASLSTQQSWERTLALVEEHLRGEKPKWIQATGGPKVMAFYESIKSGGKTKEVCLDRHMACAAAGRKLTKLELKRFFDSPRRQRLVAGQVRRLALENDLYPAQMQAILWVTWRRLYRFRRAK